jgi:preprotein translocase subunit SecA
VLADRARSTTNQQRLAIYGIRKEILDGENLERTVLDMMGDVTSSVLDQFVPQDVKPDLWDLKGLNTSLQQQFGFSKDFTEKVWTQEEITDFVGKKVKEDFDEQKNKLAQFFVQVQKMILLQTIDQRWKEHLQLIDHLKEGIGLRGYAQKDPLIEYKKEAFSAFENLNHVIKAESIEKLFKIQLVVQDQQAAESLVQDMVPEDDEKELIYQAPSETPSTGVALGASSSSIEDNGKSSEKKKNTWKAGPPPPQSEQSRLNRADRRKLEKKGRP